MLTDENKAILDVLTAVLKNDKEIPASSFEKALFNAFIWHFTEKRSWSDEIIKKQAIKTEIEKLETLLNGNATDKDANRYLNQFYQYLHYNIFENSVLKIELLRFAAKIKIKYSFKLVKQLLGLKIFQKKYENPEAFLNTVEREANDLTKVDSPHISQKLNNILSGYKKKYDERAEPLFKALLHFKEYLESYGKYGNLLTETRFKSNLPNDKIQSYFSKLNVVNKSETKFLGCQIVSSEELQSFLYSNFRNFNPAISKVPIKANCSNAALIRFFYEFCQIESKIESISPSVFHKMLKDNFQNLENTELKTIKKEFARVRPVHFPFD